MTIKLRVDSVMFGRMQRAAVEADGDPGLAAFAVTGIDRADVADAIRAGNLEVINDLPSTGDHFGRVELRQ